MPDEPRLTISSSPLVNPEDVARHDFASARKGFDPHEVRTYLESLANVMRSFAEREHQLLEAVADAEHRAANPVLDEPTLTGALGKETARVLHSAHEVANEMVGKAEAEATAKTTEADAHAERVVTEADAHAERVVTEADAKAARTLSEAREEAERLVGEATVASTEQRTRTEAWVAERTQAADAAAEDTVERARQRADALVHAAEREADELRDAARDEGRAMVEEAQQVRARVLADLARKRRTFHAQIEQLRAGRERLAETINGVRDAVDDIVRELFTAEDDAREAAEAAAREMAERGEDPTPQEVLAAELASVTAAGQAAEAAAPSPATPTPARAAAPTPTPTPTPTLTSTEPATEAEEPPAAEVDALFAKIRAGSEGSDSDTPDVATAPPARKARAKARKSTSSGAGGTGGTAKAATTATTATTATGTGTATATATAEAEEEDDSGPPDARHPSAVRRDQLIAPVVTALSRRLKRTLQDGQNELLDAVRSAKGPHWSPDLLPEETEQVDAIATAALPTLEDAAQAGAGFARPDATGLPSTDELLAMAHELAQSIVTPLRRRLEGEGTLEDGDLATVTDHVGAAFREWKGERIERVAADHVIAAFSAGTLAALQGSDGATVEWLSVPAAGAEAPCPDCEDNGLNGAQGPGEPFPTGHRSPPAHPGCRCLLAPTTA